MLRDMKTQVIAIEKTPVSYENITIPASVVTGGLIGLLATFSGIVWWIRGVKSDVDSNTAKIAATNTYLAEKEKKDVESLKSFKDDIRIMIKTEVASSANDICHSFELFAQEQRQINKTILDSIMEKRGHLATAIKRIEHLDREMMGLAIQLNRSDVEVHLRQFKDDND